MFGNKRVYLDWAASAPVSRVAQRALNTAIKEYGNPSSPHEEGARAKRALEGARASIARLAEVKPAGVVLTSGATEANNLAIEGYVRALGTAGVEAKDIHILYLPSAHASVTKTIEKLGTYGMQTEPLVITDGKIDLGRLKEQLRPETRLVAVDAVCGEMGTKWDTRGVRNTLDSYTGASRTQGVLEAPFGRILLHVDASQAPLGLPWSLTRFSADTLSVDAQKVGGIRGIGALCMRSHVKIAGLMQGGGQEGGLRPGTEPVALAAAFAVALEEAERDREAFAVRARSARTELVTTLSAAIPDMLVNVGRGGVPHILSLSFPGRDMDYAVMLLSRGGFAVATKSACETDSEHGSRAVLALTAESARARSTLRISWGPSTSSRDLNRFARALVRTVRFLDGTSVY